MNKIVLLGKNGQVGQELCRTLLPLGELTALSRADLDLQNTAVLLTQLAQLKPHIIVNSAAYTAVDKAETEQTNAREINETAVALLADYAKKNDILLIHYSTDYVFNGKKQSPYLEQDPTDPLNVYGSSKLAGEQAIAASGCRHLIFRTSWVYSALGKNFIKTILDLARHKQHLNVVCDQQGAPTSAELIADVSAHAINAHQKDLLANGLYHLTAGGATNWCDLARYALEKTLGYPIHFSLHPENIEPILSASYPTPAERPKNSRLDTTYLSNQLNLTLPNWTNHVDRMINQLIQMRYFT